MAAVDEDDALWDFTSLVMGRSVWEIDPPMRIPTDVSEIAALRPFSEADPGPADLGPFRVDAQPVDIPTTGDVHVAGELTVPDRDGDLPLVVYVHGGGWFAGSARMARRPARRLAASGRVVLNLEYPLAPEHPFPAGLEAVVAAVRWARTALGDLGAAAGPMVVMGDSAGANLVAAATHQLLDDGDPPPDGIVLMSGVFDFPMWAEAEWSNPGPASGLFDVAYNLGYLGTHFFRRYRDPRVSPVYSPHLGQFPPTYVACGTRDMVLPQSLRLAGALAAAGAPMSCSIVADMDHCYMYYEHRRRRLVTPEVQRMLSWLQTVQPVGTDSDGSAS